MPTGACGVNCDVCQLNLRGICSTCGSGKSAEGAKKEAAQVRILGSPCPILACARMNRIDFCIRDCDQFPCDNFETGPYPFSKGYLQMQQRRRKEKRPTQAPSGGSFPVPENFWADLAAISMETLRETAGANPDPPDGLTVSFLNEVIRVNLKNPGIEKKRSGTWQRVDEPLLELMVVVYLRNANYSNIRNELISEKDLKNAHFFQGPHALRTNQLLRRFAHDPDRFTQAGGKLGGRPLQTGDAAFSLPVFPKIPVSYILWEGDDEFPANLSILFDRSIEQHLPADAIWGVVTLVSDALLNA